MRSVVWRDIGSSKRSSPSRSVRRLRSTRRRRPQDREELAAGELDVAGAERDHDVVLADQPGEVAGDVLAPRHVGDVAVAVIADRLREARALDAGDGRLAGGEDVADHDRIGVVEGDGELVEKIARPRVAV